MRVGLCMLQSSAYDIQRSEKEQERVKKGRARPGQCGRYEPVPGDEEKAEILPTSLPSDNQASCHAFRLFQAMRGPKPGRSFTSGTGWPLTPLP